MYDRGWMTCGSAESSGNNRTPGTIAHRSVKPHHDASIIRYCFSYEDSSLVPLYFLPAGSYWYCRYSGTHRFSSAHFLLSPAEVGMPLA